MAEAADTNWKNVSRQVIKQQPVLIQTITLTQTLSATRTVQKIFENETKVN